MITIFGCIAAIIVLDRLIFARRWLARHVEERAQKARALAAQSRRQRRPRLIEANVEGQSWLIRRSRVKPLITFD